VNGEIGSDVAAFDREDAIQGLFAFERSAARIDHFAVSTPNLARSAGMHERDVRIFAAHLDRLQQIVDTDVGEAARKLRGCDRVQLEAASQERVAQLLVERAANGAAKLANPVFQLVRCQPIQRGRLL
jgi:hypothetical protein